jgi:hypothetical protein
MDLSLRTALVALAAFVAALLPTPPAHACSCAGVELRDAVAGAAAVAIVDVEEAKKGPLGNESRAVVVEGLKGADAGEVLTVSWRTPDGRSCDFVNLRPGRWLVFLGPDHHVGRCDQYSKPRRRVTAATLDQIRRFARPTTAADAVRAARPVAEGALQTAWHNKPEAARVASPGRWIKPDATPTVTGDAAKGFRVQWSSAPTAGFSHDVVVEIRGTRVVVTSVRADYAPD